MTTEVKVFTFGAQLPGRKFVTNSPYADLKFPLINRQRLILDSETAKSTDEKIAPKGTHMALIQIERGKRVLMEVNSPSTASKGIAASVDSMWFEGEHIVEFGEGWTISVLDPENLPCQASAKTDYVPIAKFDEKIGGSPCDDAFRNPGASVTIDTASTGSIG